MVHLFSATHETHRKGSEGETGTGFGMSIVKFYVNLYGGTVEFESKTKEESEYDLENEENDDDYGLDEWSVQN